MDINPEILERLKDQQLNQDDSWLKRQVSAMKAMQDEKIPVVAKPELVADRLVSSFKMGALAGLFAAAVGGAAGAAIGMPALAPHWQARRALEASSKDKRMRTSASSAKRASTPNTSTLHGSWVPDRGSPQPQRLYFRTPDICPSNHD